MEQLPRGHSFLPIVQDHIPGCVSIRQNHSGVVGTDTVACVAIDACAKRVDFTRLQVYLETLDVWGLTIVSEEVGDVLFLVAMDARYLLVPILVSKERLGNAAIKRNEVWLIILVAQLVNHKDRKSVV